MTSESTKFRIEMEHISKSFPNVKALDDVTIHIQPGEVHGLVGENGAGKSTLIKILSGAYQKDSGRILIDGKEIDIKNPTQALAEGLVTIYQETNTALELTVAENIFMGRLPRIAGIWVDHPLMYASAQKVLDELGINISSKQTTSELSAGQLQIIEIAKALTMDVKVIVLDEPTAALTDKETDVLFNMIRRLSQKGVSIIFITHRLVEVFEICNRVTVLRDGRWVSTSLVSEVNEDTLVNHMVGRNVSTLFPKSITKIGSKVLEVENLHGKGFSDVTFSINQGEIVGFFGLVGSGRTEVARALFGADVWTSGTVNLAGKSVHIKSPQEAILNGISLVPEERKSEGLILGMSVRSNITLPSLRSLSLFGFVQFAKELLLAKKYKEALRIKCNSIEMKAQLLSGGNQQKIVIAKWLAKNPKVLLMDEPTRGIDVSGKAEVHGLMSELANNGVGILMISSELPEILGMSDRILVMHEGRLVANIPREKANEEMIMFYAAGQSERIESQYKDFVSSFPA